MPRRTGYSVPTMTRSRRLWSALVSFASPGPVNCFYRLWHSRKRCAVGFPAHPASTGNNSKSRQRRPMTHTVWGWLKRSVRDQRAMANIQSTCIMWSWNWVTQCVMEVIFLSYWATFKKKHYLRAHPLRGAANPVCCPYFIPYNCNLPRPPSSWCTACLLETSLHLDKEYCNVVVNTNTAQE